jgi:hypothetical protein
LSAGHATAHAASRNCTLWYGVTGRHQSQPAYPNTTTPPFLIYIRILTVKLKKILSRAWVWL